MIIHSQKMAAFLMLSGFVLQGIEKTKQPGSTRNVFIFNDSDEINAKIPEYKRFITKLQN